ncbi:MAG: DNA polymerase IV [Oscillospiraceae bacterium]|jgi:DNA polymerase-4|nr:DNA polymerase IV [Oscillospiraceae bacterium]
MPVAGRVILHCDCNAFFASVEETFEPALKAVPMAIAGDAESRRGIILAKNELAKKYDIKTAETIWSAKRKCPELVLRPPRRGAYGEFCGRVNAIYEDYTAYVERFGIDESFLDLTGFLHRFEGPGAQSPQLRAANEIRQRVKSEIGITISIGMSWNKVFAKLGSDYKKPDAVTVIDRDNWRRIVFPLPAGDLLGVGKKTAATLAKYNIRTIGDLAGISREALREWFGKLGEQLYINANGLDESPVALTGEVREAKSIGNNMTFKRDLMTESDIRLGVGALSDKVAARLRKAGKKCRVVQVTIKDTKLKTITRQTTLEKPAFTAAELTDAAVGLIARHWKAGAPIRMLAVTAEHLVPANEAELGQLTLFGDNQRDRGERTEKLELTLDKIRGKYGGYSIQRAAVLGNDLGISYGEGEGK